MTDAVGKVASMMAAVSKKNTKKASAQTSPNKPVSQNIKVIARFRPQIDIENTVEESEKSIQYQGTDTVSLWEKGEPTESFTFDRVYGSDSTQLQMFETVGAPICAEVVNGYNGTVFAYGQTGSGKTHTMMGEDLEDFNQRGIVPRCATFIFDWVDQQETNSEFTIKISMIEIYKEMIHDLLNPQADNLQVKEDKRRGIYVKDLSEYCVVSEDELLEIISIGEEARTVSATKMNKQSSRSHQIVMVEFIEKMETGSEKKGKLNLVDLAGSEKISRTGVTGKNLEEAQKINLSLSCLGNVINALVKHHEHIPYRDSKLTRLLQESLGGNYKTTLIVAASPHPSNFEDTLNTLKFAGRAKTIKNKAKANVQRSPAEYMRIITQYKQENERLKKKIMKMKSGKPETPPSETPLLKPAKSEGIPSITVTESGEDTKEKKSKKRKKGKEDSAHKRMDNIGEEPSAELSSSFLSQQEAGSPSGSQFGSPEGLLSKLIGFQRQDSTTSLGDLLSMNPSIAIEDFVLPGFVTPAEHAELQRKVEKLDEQLLEKLDEIQELKDQLADQKRQTEKKAAKLHQFSKEYKQYSDKMISQKKAEYLKAKNKTLKAQVAVMKKSMRVTNFKYQNLLHKAMGAGLQLDEFEFETVNITEIIDDTYLETLANQEMSINYCNLPVETEAIFETAQISDKISDITGIESNSKDTTIYHLKNQLMQACLINYNIRRSLTYLECKNYLSESRRKLLNTRSLEQKKSIASLEDMLDTLHSTLNHFMNQPASPVTVVSPQNQTGMNLQAVPAQGLVTRGNVRQPTFLEVAPPPRAAVMRRMTRLTSRVGGMPMLPALAPGMSVPADAGLQPRFQRQNTVRIPTIAPGNLPVLRNNATSVVEEGCENVAYSNAVPGIDHQDLKNLQTQLETAKLYNIQLVKQSHLTKNELEVLNHTLIDVERKMKNYYVVHFDHWGNLFSDFKQNCEFELKRKQVEIVNLQEALVDWERKYKNIARKMSKMRDTPRSRTGLTLDFYDGLIDLCSKHPVSPAKSPMKGRNTPHSYMSFTPRAGQSLMNNIGDHEPLQNDTEDFEW